MSTLRRLWHETDGAIQTAELVLIGTLLGLGAIVGLSTLRAAIVEELADTAAAISAINQSFSSPSSSNNDNNDPPTCTTVTYVPPTNESGSGGS
jgi:hypothetical protein